MEFRMTYQQICPAIAIEQNNLSEPALRSFFKIAKLWNLSGKDQMTLLGMTAQSTFFKWKRNPNVVLPKDMLERISYILGIYKALQILLPDERTSDQWVKRPNQAPFFNGQSALNRMLSGQVADLFVVRQYLDAQLGG